ncbi:MAG: lysophospholipid acyltransferase family protein [Candidatus Margulisbacteria bacterium]|nr:lysophospholipid acyltransferase family protein [Candidatus Margulisiibacteriota bacterium]
MKNIFNKIYALYFLLMGVVLVVVTYLMSITILLFLGKKAKYTLRKLYKMNSRLILILQGIVPKVSGKFPKGTFVFCMNHQSDLDILIALALLPSGFLFVAKEELLRVPFIGSLIKMAGYITIDRKNNRRSTETLDQIKMELTQGRSVLVFPEGTRSMDGEIQKIKRGGIQVAFQTRTPVVPVVNDPVFKIFNKSATNISYHKVKTMVGKPIVYDWENHSRDYSMESAMQLEIVMKELLSSIRK